MPHGCCRAIRTPRERVREPHVLFLPVHLRPERAQHPHDPPRLVREVEEPVRIDAQPRPGDLLLTRDRRPLARCDAYPVRLQSILVSGGRRYLALGRREQVRSAVVLLDAFFLDDAVEAADVCVALGLECRPGELGRADSRAIELVAFCVADLLWDVRGVLHYLWMRPVSDRRCVLCNVVARTFFGSHSMQGE